MNLFRACHKITTGRLRISRICLAHHSTSVRDFKVTLDGDALYIDKELAEALGWTTGLSTEGLPLRLSGWEPHYFVITRPGTDADFLARGTIESSRNPRVQQVIDYLKKSDAGDP